MSLAKEEQFKGHIGDSAETLYNALELEDKLGTKLEKVYAHPKTRPRYNERQVYWYGVKSTSINY